MVCHLVALALVSEPALATEVNLPSSAVIMSRRHSMNTTTMRSLNNSPGIFMTPKPGQTIPFVSAAPYPSRFENFVRPLIDGVPAFRRICAAIDAAQHSVFVTVAFIHQDFLMPDGRGSFFDVLDAATRRGLDVRVIFWRTGPQTAAYERTCF